MGESLNLTIVKIYSIPNSDNDYNHNVNFSVEVDKYFQFIVLQFV